MIKHAIIDGSACLIEAIDAGGQEEYTALRQCCYRDFEWVLFVYSVNNRSYFLRIKSFCIEIMLEKESSHSTRRDPPVMLVGNNHELEHERDIQTEEGKTLAQELRCQFVETSIKDNVNVDVAFYDVVRAVRRQRLLAAGEETLDPISKEQDPAGVSSIPRLENVSKAWQRIARRMRDIRRTIPPS